MTQVTPEQWQEVLAEAKAECDKDRAKVIGEGGLYVLGTERHEARRIDNQLRGRSGRQGDPGESRFYLSLEDELMRRFGGDRVKNFMKWADMPESQPIEHGLISKSIQQAQIRVEGHNFDIRKRVLEYDDVVNMQRKTIYDQRRKILSSKPEELREQIQHMISDQIETLIDEYLPDDRHDWQLEELHRAALTIYPVPAEITPDSLEKCREADDVAVELVKGALAAYDARIAQFTPEWMGRAERHVLLGAVDQLWQRHLTDLDILREGIGLVGYGGRDPLVEYKRESYQMWTGLQEEIKAKVVHDIYRVAPAEQQRLQPRLLNIQAGRGAMPGMPMPSGAAQGTPNRQAAPEPVRKVGMYDNVGRNDPCPCGSGKKFKYCHYKEMQNQRQTVNPEEVKRAVPNRRRH